MSERRVAAWAVVVAVLGATPAPASAFSCLVEPECTTLCAAGGPLFVGELAGLADGVAEDDVVADVVEASLRWLAPCSDFELFYAGRLMEGGPGMFLVSVSIVPVWDGPAGELSTVTHVDVEDPEGTCWSAAHVRLDGEHATWEPGPVLRHHVIRQLGFALGLGAASDPASPLADGSSASEVTPDDVEGLCALYGRRGGGGTPCAACVDDVDCGGGACLAAFPEGPRCVPPCGEFGCAPGYTCTTVTVGDAPPADYCMPGDGSEPPTCIRPELLCQPCDACVGLCASFGPDDPMYCFPFCTDPSTCPRGECRDVGFGGTLVCVALGDGGPACAGACVPAPEVCNAVDDDCDAAVDEGCAGPGEPCGEDAPCVPPTSCVEGTCQTACDPARPTVGCPPGSFCATAGECGAGACVPGAPGPAAIGDGCAADTDCVTGLCLDPGDGDARCAARCGPRAGCFASEVCVTDGCGCAAAERAPGPRGLGEACAADADCRSGECRAEAGARYCTAPCATVDDCGPGTWCRAGTCARGRPGRLGEPCLRGEDCDSGLCLDSEAGGARVCSRLCEGTPCPEGSTCVGDRPPRFCAPDRAVLGEECGGDEGCVAGECIRGRCTARCDRGTPCPARLECREEPEGGLCLGPRGAADGGGGCAVGTPRAAAAAAAWLAAAVLLLLRRRR